MSGLIFGSMLRGVGAAGAGLSEAMTRGALREQDLAQRAADRRDELEYRRQTQLELQAMKNAGKDGGGSGITEIKEGGLAEEAMANRLGISVPELRAQRRAVQTGEGGIDASKQRALAAIQEEFLHGKDYKAVTEGRGQELQNDVGRGIVGGTMTPEAGGKKVAALAGKEMYGESGGVVVDKFEGSTKTTPVGESQIVENRAQAGKAAADAAKAKDETAGGVKPKDMIATIESQRKDIKDEITAVRDAQRAELAAEISPAKKQAIIARYNAKLEQLEARRTDLEEQFQALRKRMELPTRGGEKKDTPKPGVDDAKKPQAGDNGNVKPAAGGVPAPKSKAEYDALPKGTRYRDPTGAIRIKG